MKTFVAAWALGVLSSISFIALVLTTVVRSLDAKIFVWDDVQWLWGGLTLAAAVCAVLLAAVRFAREF